MHVRRADVTRLDSLGEAPPLENEGSLSGFHLLTKDACEARQVLREVQRLGQEICQLRRSPGGIGSDQSNLTTSSLEIAIQTRVS